MPAHHPTRDLTTHWRQDDARRLARMFDESHAGWPGGFGEAEHRPEDVERWVRESDALGVFVAEADGRIVAYCDLSPEIRQPDLAYVGLLNADPKYHGRGFGKAVLLSAVERAFERGFDRVELGTWAGNLKAVPLYKKSGFMWRPESHVHMDNFTPGIRRMPIAQAFFAKHDWYDTQQRDLSPKEDLFKRGKVRVYPYLWEADGDMLRVVIDRASWGPLEIETNDLRVACFLPDEKLVAGLPHPIRWEISNKRPGAMEVTLIAAADTGVRIDASRVLSVKRRARIEAEFVADPQMPEKEEEPRAAIITSTLIMHGQPVELKAGFGLLQPVGIRTDPTAICLRPGRRERVLFSINSNLGETITFRPQIEPASQAQVEHPRRSLRLGPHGTAAFNAQITVPASGPVPLQAGGRARVGQRTVEMKPADLMLRALQGLECVGSVSKHQLVLESATLRVEQSRQGGWLRVFDKARPGEDSVSVPPPGLGPPFTWEELFKARADAQVERTGDLAVGIITTESATRRGVRLQRRLRLAPGPLVEVSDTLINGSPQRLAVRVLRRAQMPVPHWHGHVPLPTCRLAAPTPQGIVTTQYAGLGEPPHALGLREEAEFWPEGWAAHVMGDGRTYGVIFSPPHRVGLGWGVGFETVVDPMEPGAARTLDPFYLFVGEGDHLTVRRWWRSLFGAERVDFKEPAPPQRPSVEFGLEPSPVVVAAPQASVRAVVRAVGRRKYDAVLRLAPGKGISLSVRQVRFRGVNEELSAARALVLRRRAQECVSEVRLTLDTGNALLRQAAPVIALGSPGERVAVSRHGDEWVMRNGVLAAQVAPKFCGSLVSLVMKGDEYLRSSYPQAGPLAFWNPWHGGIRPDFLGLGGNLWDERFTAGAVSRTGAQGVAWKGVRVSCRPKHESARHLRLELDYLLAPGSAVMAVVCRMMRSGETSAQAGPGFELWPLLGGSPLDAIFSCEAHPEGALRRTEWNHHLALGGWGMVENPRTHHALLIAAGDAGTWLSGSVIGRPGYMLRAAARDRIAAGEAIQAVFYIVVGRDPQQVRSFSALAGMRNLP